MSHYDRSRSRQPRNAYSRSPSPTVVGSRAPSRIASTIDLPREQDYGQTFEPRQRPLPRHHSHRGHGDTLTKASIFVAVFTVLAGVLRFWIKHEEDKRYAKHQYEEDRERKRDERRRRKRNEERMRRQKAYDEWHENATQPRLAITQEPCRGNSTGKRSHGGSYRHDVGSETKSRYGSSRDGYHELPGAS